MFEARGLMDLNRQEHAKPTLQLIYHLLNWAMRKRDVAFSEEHFSRLGESCKVFSSQKHAEAVAVDFFMRRECRPEPENEEQF